MAGRLILGAALLASALVPAGPLAAQAGDGGLPTDVLARMVQRGEVLSPDDFTTREIPAAQARGALAAQDAAGLEARRTLRADMPVRAGDLIAPRLVRRGEPVTIWLRDGALSISAGGRALGDAALGETVRVVNEATGQTLEAGVEGPAAVRIAAR